MHSIKCFVPLVLLILLLTGFSDNSFSDKSNSSTRKLIFTSVDSPTKNNIHKIVLTKENDGIAAGNYLLRFSGQEFNIDNSSKNLNNIWNISSNKNGFTILEQKVFPLSFSKLYTIQNNILKEFKHPFGNEVSAIHVTEKNNVWIGGDREIAFYNGKWTQIPYPTTLWSISQIFGDDDLKVWVRTRTDNKLFFYNGKSWQEQIGNNKIDYFLFRSINTGWILSGTNIYKFENGKWSTSFCSPLLSKINHFTFDNSGSLWCIGNNGIILRNINKNWIEYSGISKENLSDIVFNGKDNGWIVGDNGTIISFSPNQSNIIKKSSSGFIAVNPIASYSNLDEQYGVAIEDLDNDGLNDIYAVSLYHTNQFYKNLYKITDKEKVTQFFTEDAFERNLTGFTDSESFIKQVSKIQHGVAVADVDNDGDEDVYITNLAGKNTLLLNNGHGFFRDVSNQSNRGVGENERTNSAIFSDVDNDGDLDLFITNEYTSNRLYANNGFGYFKEITTSAGLTTKGGSICAAFADFDNDGLQDLFVTNWGKPNLLYKNITDKNGNIRFVNKPITTSALLPSINKSNAVACADVNNDGLLDIFVTNRGQNNQLYINQEYFLFEDETKKYFDTNCNLSYGASFADFDNDGYQDLYVSNVGENIFYKNIEGGKFEDVTVKYGAELSGYCTGSATGDVDNDGDIDLYAANFTNGSSKLFVNQTDNNCYIQINLEGTISNRDAVGARVNLYLDDSTGKFIEYREVSSGSGYASHSSKQVHFGVRLGNKYKLVVYFPASGIRKTINNIIPGTRIYVCEEDGTEKAVTRSALFANRILLDQENQLEIAKLFVALIFCFTSFSRCRKKYKWNIYKSISFQFPIITVYVITNYLLMLLPLVFSIIIPYLVQVVFLFLFHLYYERIILTRRINEEHKNTRDQIARDLHDNLASTIGSGLIYADSLTRSLQNDQAVQSKLAGTVTSLLAEASEAITDLVWTVSPIHDSLQDLISRLRFYISSNCQCNNLQCKIDINLEDTDQKISELQKKNIFLILKEGFHNILKHSNATEVGFNIYRENGRIVWNLKDNGKGLSQSDTIDNKETAHGNGITNMKKRALELGAEFNFYSTRSEGTRLELKTKMN